MSSRSFLQTEGACRLDVVEVHGEAMAGLVARLAGLDLENKLFQEVTPVRLTAGRVGVRRLSGSFCR